MVFGLPAWTEGGIAILGSVLVIIYIWKRHKHRLQETGREVQQQEIKVQKDIQHSTKVIEPLLQDIDQKIEEGLQELEKAGVIDQEKGQLISRNTLIPSRLKAFNSYMLRNPQSVNNKKALAVLMEGQRNPAAIGNVIYHDERWLDQQWKSLQEISTETRKVIKEEKKKAGLEEDVKDLEKRREKKDRKAEASTKKGLSKALFRTRNLIRKKEKGLSKLERKDLKLEHHIIHEEREFYEKDIELRDLLNAFSSILKAEAHAIRSQKSIIMKTIKTLTHYREGDKIKPLRWEKYLSKAQKLARHHQKELETKERIEGCLNDLKDIALHLGSEEHLLDKTEREETKEMVSLKAA